MAAVDLPPKDQSIFYASDFVEWEDLTDASGHDTNDGHHAGVCSRMGSGLDAQWLSPPHHFYKTGCMTVPMKKSLSEIVVEANTNTTPSQETIRVANAFLELVVKYRVQCLSQIQYETGISLEHLRSGRDLLLERGFIEPIPECKDLDPKYHAYKLAT